MHVRPALARHAKAQYYARSRDLDAAITMLFADTALLNTTQLRTTVQEITAPKRDLDAKAGKSTILKAS